MLVNSNLNKELVRDSKFIRVTNDQVNNHANTNFPFLKTLSVNLAQFSLACLMFMVPIP